MDSNTQAPDGTTDNGTVQDNGTQEVSKVYSTRAEAEANKPTEGKKRLFAVTKDGVVRYLWSNGYVNAIDACARADGYTAALAGKEITVEAAAARLANLDDATLAALGLTRRPQSGRKK
jgi:hypothetical protein